MKRLPILFAVVLFIPPALLAQGGEENRRYMLAKGYEESGDFKNAARVYKELYDSDPGSNTYFEGVRRTYMGLLRYAELLPIVEARVRRLPREVELRAFHASLLHRTQKRDEAIDEWQSALELRPTEETYDLVARSQAELKLYPIAVETYRQGRVVVGSPGAFAHQLAELYGITGRYADATAEYMMLLDDTSDNLPYVMGGLGLFTTSADAADAAIEVVKRRLEGRPDHLPYLELLSWLYTERGDYDGALEIAKTFDRVRGGGGSGIYRFADQALRERHYESAMNAFKYFMEHYPKSSPIYPNVLLGYTRALEGRYRDGGRSKGGAETLVAEYRKVIADNAGTVPAAEAMLQVARLQADDLDQPDDAIATLDALRKEYPSFPLLPEALLLQGDLNLRRGNLSQARELYEAAGIAAPAGDDQGKRYRDMGELRYAEVLFYTGRFKEAQDAFSGLTHDMRSEAANDALAYLFLIQENMGKYDSSLAHYGRGSYMIVQHKWKEAIAEMDAAAASGRESSLADRALFGKARAQEGGGDNAGAVETLLGVVKDYPDGAMADRALFHAAELAETRLGDTARAMELYTRLLTEYPTSAQVNPARTRIRALRGNS